MNLLVRGVLVLLKLQVYYCVLFAVVFKKLGNYE